MLSSHTPCSFLLLGACTRHMPQPLLASQAHISLRVGPIFPCNMPSSARAYRPDHPCDKAQLARSVPSWHQPCPGTSHALAPAMPSWHQPCPAGTSHAQPARNLHMQLRPPCTHSRHDPGRAKHAPACKQSHLFCMAQPLEHSALITNAGCDSHTAWLWAHRRRRPVRAQTIVSVGVPRHQCCPTSLKPHPSCAQTKLVGAPVRQKGLRPALLCAPQPRAPAPTHGLHQPRPDACTSKHARAHRQTSSHANALQDSGLPGAYTCACTAG